MENKILYFVTHEVEYRWAEQKCNKSIYFVLPLEKSPFIENRSYYVSKLRESSLFFIKNKHM